MTRGLTKRLGWLSESANDQYKRICASNKSPCGMEWMGGSLSCPSCHGLQVSSLCVDRVWVATKHTTTPRRLWVWWGGIYECVRKVQSWKPCGTEPMSKIYYEWCGDNDWVWVKTIVSYISVEHSRRTENCAATIRTVRFVEYSPSQKGHCYN